MSYFLLIVFRVLCCSCLIKNELFWQDIYSTNRGFVLTNNLNRYNLLAMEDLRHYIELVAKIIESAGVLIIATGSLFFIIRYLVFLVINQAKSFTELRHELGKAILLGLEVLVAADIIATVSTEPTMNSVLVLAVIVLVRTFLSFSLQVELEGKFPWQKNSSK